MSPEAMFETSYSAQSDVWALGMLLYEMIKGKPLVSTQS
jgi:serine/threonine protein kinase